MPRRVGMRVCDRCQARRCAGGGLRSTRITWTELAARNRSAVFRLRSALARFQRSSASQHRHCARGSGTQMRAVSGCTRRSHIGSAVRCGQPAASVRNMRCRRTHPRRRGFATGVANQCVPNRLFAGLRKTRAGADVVSPSPEAHLSGRRAGSPPRSGAVGCRSRRRGGDVASARLTR
jgi:hypothetical protein